MELDAIIPAGRASARLGGRDKAVVEVAGTRLLDRAVAAAGMAARVFVVGPPRPGFEGVEWVSERSPDGGPAAAIASGLERATASLILVLACDMPYVDAPLVRSLVAAAVDAEDADGAVAVDASGRSQYLAGVYRRAPLKKALGGAGPGAGLTASMSGLGLARVGAGNKVADVDTWKEISSADVTLSGDAPPG